MRPNWPEYFRTAAEIQAVAEKSGTPRARARACGERLAAHPLPRHEAIRILRHIGRAGAGDPVLVAALRHLQTLAPEQCPRLEDVRLLTLGDRHGCCLHGVIVIDPTSPFFRAAAGGDLLPLAGLLHHEQFHALHGSEEVPALEASLKFSESHHADTATVAEIKQRLAEETKMESTDTSGATCPPGHVCPRCSPEMGSVARMTSAEYATYLTKRTDEALGSAGLRAATMRTNVHATEADNADNVPDIYAEPLKRLRHAQHIPEPETDASALARMERNRASFYRMQIEADYHDPTTSDYLKSEPPSGYSEAALAKFRKECYR